MDTARYVLAVMLIVTMPPALLYWFLIHPLVGFWRRLGRTWAFVVVVAVCIGSGYVLYRWREPLLGADLGTDLRLLIPAVPLYAASIALDRLARRHLKFRILAGAPELGGPETGSGGAKGSDEGSGEGSAPGLLREGIYGRVRHPRYLAIMVGMPAWALFINYVGIYLLLPVLYVALWLIVLLEERELRARFGAAYEEYCGRVPRFLPMRRAA